MPASPVPRSTVPGDPGAIAAARAAERAVVIGYMPADRRAGGSALLALDDVLAGIVRTTREPIVGQMRLTWWHGALEALDHTSPPGEPVLTALAADALPHGVEGRTLAAMIDGWQLLLDPAPLEDAALHAFAAGRGGTIFAALATLLGTPATAAVMQAGAGWALADLARHLRDPAQVAAARTLATTRMAGVFDRRWPAAARPIGMLTLIARADLAATTPRSGSPARLLRLLMHRIWGR